MNIEPGMQVGDYQILRELGAGGMGKVFSGPKWKATDYRDLLSLLFLLTKALVKYPELYEAPKDNTPPPFPIRALLVLTCTGVSFFHGSNDGQKGMGLIMLVLIGLAPAATYFCIQSITSSHEPVTQSMALATASYGRL